MRRIALAAALLVVLSLAALAALPRFAQAPDLSALPPHAGRVEIGGGLALNVEQLGDGKPIVLVHGLPSNIGDWGGLPAALAALGHRVVVYDRVGYGWSSRAPAGGDAYTLASNARELGELLDRLGLGDVALVGWSYGGGIAQTFALEHPERVGRLVLLGSVGPGIGDAPTDWIGRLGRSPLGPPLFRAATTVPAIGRPMLEDGLAAVFSGRANIPAGWVERSAAQMALPGTVDAWLAEERNDGYTALRPEAIGAPTLVVHGDDDRAVPVEVARDLAQRLPHAELAIVPGGSHMLPVTHTDLVARRIHEWVATP